MEIMLGQTTENFRRIRTPELEAYVHACWPPATTSDALRRSSFSIIYHPAKTLDLVAKNALEYRLWTRGLNQLVQEIRQNRPVEKLQGARGAAGRA